MTDNANLEDRPLVTFALFAYNQEKYIREAVEGAFSQTYSPLEIILSDDCSSDRTFEIMQEMAAAYDGPHEVRVRQSEVNRGLSGHINELIFGATGEIITWAAGDDIALPQRTSILVEPMIKEDDVISTHSSILQINTSGNIIWTGCHSKDVTDITLSHVCKSGKSIVSQSHAFRKRVFDVYGPFRSDLTNEGSAMAFRELNLGRVVYLKDALTKYRIGSGTSTWSGNDLKRRQFSEPQKIVNWSKTKFQQMGDDLLVECGGCTAVDRRNITRNINFFTALLAINGRQKVFSNLLKCFAVHPLDLRPWRAFARVCLPVSLYAKLMTNHRT